MDYIIEEIKDAQKFLSDEKNLELFLIFQVKHDIQVIRGEDYQYECHINKKVYATGLTPIGSMLYGIKKYISIQPKTN